MKYQILAVGLKHDQISHCKEYFAKMDTSMKIAISIPEASQVLKVETIHLHQFLLSQLAGY